MPQLKMPDYMHHIKLGETYTLPLPSSLNKEVLLNELLDSLCKERQESSNKRIPMEYGAKRNLLKALLTTREPAPLELDFLEKMDALLQLELREKGVVNADQLETVYDAVPNNAFLHSNKFSLWQGDITRLQVDTIVNAANKYMLGCFQPMHACIDNAIHSTAGPRLREDCNLIMSLQQELEETGTAKITRGYNLPSKFVIHTVGPIVPEGTPLTESQKAELASCYTSCLELASERDEIRTIAFCAVSTGVFGFPKHEAAVIAVTTVHEWIQNNPDRFEKIIFNVFSNDDYKVYQNIFKSHN